MNGDIVELQYPYWHIKKNRNILVDNKMMDHQN